MTNNLDYEELGVNIIDEFNHYYMDNCQFEQDEYDDYVKYRLYDYPNYSEYLKDTIEKYITKDMSKDFIDNLNKYVYENVPSEKELQKWAKERQD